MQKKTVGILAGVAAAHAVLLVGMMVGGGCRQHNILGPHSYNNGPAFNENRPAPAVPEPQTEVAPPVVPGGAAVPPPIAVTPPPAVKPQPVEPILTPPVAPVAPKPVAGTTTYKVKRGDTLSGIAYRHGVRMSDLAACNNLTGKKINSLYIGQTLTIPEGGVYNPNRAPKKRAAAVRNKAKRTSGKRTTVKTAAALPADGIYVVKSGDTLDRIGRRYGVSGRAIAKENNIAVTKVLHIGDKLRIPGKAAAAPVATQPTTTNSDPLNTSDLGNDLDPNAGIDNTSAPAADNAAPATQPAAAPTAPAAEQPAAAPAEVRTESIEVPNDTTVEEYSKQIMVSVEDLRRLNPAIPADGKLKGGTYLVIPSL